MYRIKLDGADIYAPSLVDTDSRYFVINPRVVMEKNRAGSLEFTLHQNNIGYNHINKMRSDITVYDDDEIIFHGRPIDTTRTFYNLKDVTCEGALAWLNDTLIPPQTFSGSYFSIFERLINIHNGQVEPSRQFRVGDISMGDNSSDTGSGVQYNVEEIARAVIRGEYGSGAARRRRLEAAGYSYELVQNKVNEILGASFRYPIDSSGITPNTSITYELEDYKTSFDFFTEDWLELTGGGIRTRSVEENGVVVTYLDTMSENGSYNEQEIVFAENLFDFEEFIDASEVYTRLIPLGKRDPDTNEYLTISSINSGKNYVEDADAIALYGIITRTASFNDIESKSELKKAGEEELKKGLNEALTLTIKAIDMTLLGVNADAFYVGGFNRILSPPHHYDQYQQCTKIELDLQNPANNVYTFGVEKGSITGSLNGEILPKNNGAYVIFNTGA